MKPLSLLLGLLSAGAMAALPVPSFPEDAAAAVARALSERGGALLPGREPPRVDGGEIILPADGGAWPAAFLDGLVPARRFGVDVYPFEIQIDDRTGDAVFRNADRCEFFRVGPRPYAPADWLSVLLGEETAPWARSSHLVAEWRLVPEADAAAYFEARADHASDAAAARAFLSRSESGPDPVTNLVFTGISVQDDTTALSVVWPAGLLPSGSQIGLFAKPDLSEPGWTRVQGLTVTPGRTNGAWVVTNSLLDEQLGSTEQYQE